MIKLTTHFDNYIHQNFLFKDIVSVPLCVRVFVFCSIDGKEKYGQVVGKNLHGQYMPMAPLQITYNHINIEFTLV